MSENKFKNFVSLRLREGAGWGDDWPFSQSARLRMLLLVYSRDWISYRNIKSCIYVYLIMVGTVAFTMNLLLEQPSYITVPCAITNISRKTFRKTIITITEIWNSFLFQKLFTNYFHVEPHVLMKKYKFKMAVKS